MKNKKCSVPHTGSDDCCPLRRSYDDRQCPRHRQRQHSGSLLGSPHRPSLSDSRRSSRTLYRLSDRQPRDRCHAARYHFWFPRNPDRCNRHMDAWKSSPRQGRKAEKAFHLAVPSAAYPGKRRDYPACVKIRLRHPSDVVFRDYRNGRGNHFLRYLRTDSVGCAEKIQKPVVPRLNGKKHKKGIVLRFLEVTIPFFLPTIECTLCEHSIVMNMQ